MLPSNNVAAGAWFLASAFFLRRLRSLRWLHRIEVMARRAAHIASGRLMLAALALFPQSSVKMAPPRRSHRFAQ